MGNLKVMEFCYIIFKAKRVIQFQCQYKERLRKWLKTFFSLLEIPLSVKVLEFCKSKSVPAKEC